MRTILDEVHVVGMPDDGSTYLTVNEVCDDDGNVVLVEPPIEVILEGENTRVAVTQGSLVARYNHDELGQIGEGNPILGLNRVIGVVAVSDGLIHGAIKPLHPTLIEAQAIEDQAELASPWPPVGTTRYKHHSGR